MREPTIEETDRRYCRICYNTNGWRRPTGTADEATDSYYATNGFGHEEWLFNYEWCIAGYKYAFLQPFNGVASHRGKWFSLKLYTNFGGRSFLAGTISKVYVPHDDELKSVYDHMHAQHWIEQMREDVRALPRGSVAELDTDKPELFINVRFRQEDVEVFDRMPEYLENTKPRSTDRYRLLHDEDGDWLPALAQSTEFEDLETLHVVRAAQQATTVDLAHRRLQLRLYRWLCGRHGRAAVRMEFECVDLRVTLPDGATFYEIKMETSAKKCIREAIGQLIEYSTYVDAAKAKTWVVVGDPAPNVHERAYLSHLRKTFNLPLYYAQFDWETGALRDRV